MNVALLAFVRITGDWMLYAIGALSGVAAIMLVWAIANRLGAASVDAGLVTLLFATSVVFLGNVTTLGAFDVTGATMLLLGVYGVLRLDPTSDRWWPWAMISGASFALLIGLRYTSIIIVGFVYIAILLLAGFRPRVHATALGAFALVMLGIAIYHTWLYGGPLANGYSLDGADSGSVILAAAGGQVQEVLGRHLQFYLLTFETGFPLAIGIVGFFIAARRWRTASGAIAAGLLAGLTVYTLIIGATPLWGSDFYAVNASFLRYVMPALAVATAFGALVLARFPHFVKLLLVGSIVAVSVFASAFYNAGLLARSNGIEDATGIRESVLQVTAPDAIIMTRTEEKLLWPDRRTLLISYLVEPPDPNVSLWRQLPSDDSLAAMASRLNSSGLGVFLLDGSRSFSSAYLSRFDAALASHDLRREIKIEDETWVLYTITHRPPASSIALGE